MIVAADDIIQAAPISISQGRHDVLQHTEGNRSNPPQFQPHLLQRHGGRPQYPFVQKFGFYDNAFRRLALRYDALRQLREPAGKTDKKKRVDDVEQCIGVGDLARHFRRCLSHALELRTGWGNPDRHIHQQPDEGKPYQGAQNIEHYMHCRCLHCFGGLGAEDAHQCCRGGCADVGTQRQGDACRQGQQPLARHRDGDADRCCGGLYDGSECRAGENARHRIFQSLEYFQKGLVAAQGRHCHAHQAHAVKHQTYAHDHHAVVLHLLLLGGKEHEKTDGDGAEGVSCKIESQQLGGHSAADVGSHDHPDRLGEGHHATAYEAYDQQSGYRRGVEHAGNKGTGERTLQAVGGELRQYCFQCLASGFCHPLRQQLQSAEKQGQAAEQAEEQLQPVRRFDRAVRLGGEGEKGNRQQYHCKGRPQQMVEDIPGRLVFKLRRSHHYPLLGRSGWKKGIRYYSRYAEFGEYLCPINVTTDCFGRFFMWCCLTESGPMGRERDIAMVAVPVIFH